MAEEKNPEKKKKSDNGIGFLIMCSIIGGGAYLDYANNDDAPDIDTQNSVTQVNAQYEQRLDALETLSETYRAQNEAYWEALGQGVIHADVEEQVENTKTLLQEQGIDFLEDAMTDSQLSEADVVSLTERFTAEVLSAKDLGDYNLQNVGYLSDVKQDKMSATDLRNLDEAMAEKRQEQLDDGPWLGILLAILFNDLLFVPLMKELGKAREKRQNRNGNSNPKGPQSPNGSQSLIGRAVRRLRGQPTHRH